MRRLDVGCGCEPSGTVNVDLYTYDKTAHRGKDDILNPRTVKNFVLADACHLPFKSDSFDMVYSSHVIEHVKEPYLMLCELVRVSRWKIVVKCPHSFGETYKLRYGEGHAWHFRPRWFRKALKALPCHVPNIYYSQWHGLPHDWFPLVRLPSEITVEVTKKEKTV